MWIKHNNALYNSNDISKIVVNRTKLIATFHDETAEVIGEFRATKECQDIFQSVSRALLFEDKDHPGIIIKDTKVAKEKKNSGGK